MPDWNRSSSCAGGECVDVAYVKSSYSSSGACVEAAYVESSHCNAGTCVDVAKVGDRILVRDSKHPEVPPLSFTLAEWEAFLLGARNNEFDADVLGRDR